VLAIKYIRVVDPSVDHHIGNVFVVELDLRKLTNSSWADTDIYEHFIGILWYVWQFYFAANFHCNFMYEGWRFAVIVDGNKERAREGDQLGRRCKIASVTI